LGLGRGGKHRGGQLLQRRRPEIATAVLPTFLPGVLRGSAGTLGLIEGLSDALLGVAKLLGGPLANQPARRVQLARGGCVATRDGEGSRMAGSGRERIVAIDVVRGLAVVGMLVVNNAGIPAAMP
jgi:hypothetical protein